MTMVGASSGAGPIMRYSRSEAPMRKVPEGVRAVMSLFNAQFETHFRHARACPPSLKLRRTDTESPSKPRRRRVAGLHVFLGLPLKAWAGGPSPAMTASYVRAT